MNMEKTGGFIAALRKEKGWTQAQLAEQILVSDKAVSRWETGRGFPDIGNMEALAACLDVTEAELLRGERLPEMVSKEDVGNVTTESLTLAQTFVSRRKYINTALGFLLGLVLIGALAVHMLAPIYSVEAGQSVTVEALPDGQLIAVVDSGAAAKITGFDVDIVKDAESGETHVFISGYTTRWDQLTGRTGQNMALLGSAKDIDRVFYYPGENEDALLYQRDGVPDMNGGVVTLPRLIYNGWLFIGAAASVLGLAVWFFCRKKYFGRTLLKIALLPVAFTIALPICLFGHFDEVYNAAFYCTGIAALGIVLYVALLLLMTRRPRFQGSEK